jgi:integrase
MASLAAYSGLRWGELAALNTGQIAPAARVITVDRKVVEISRQIYVAPARVTDGGDPAETWRAVSADLDAARSQAPPSR